ncbi:MAG: PilZ domain-containing protein [Sphingomicrobium sp.]
MGTAGISHSQRSRELRRRVVLPARIRYSAGWADACILNISSRGLMIQSCAGAKAGTIVELTRGPHVISARVVWSEGFRTGLQVDESISVADILTIGSANQLALAPIRSALLDPPRNMAAHDASRLQARTLQFAGTLFIGAVLSIGAFGMMQQAFAAPLAAVEAALGGG